MRNVTVRIKNNFFSKLEMKRMFSSISYCAILEFLKVDYNKLIEIAVVEVKFKDMLKKEVRFPKYMKIIDVLVEDSERGVYIVEAKFPKNMMSIMNLFDLGVIIEFPMIMTEEDIQLSCAGNQKNTSLFISACESVGNILDLSCGFANYKGYNELNILTPRQKEILSLANDLGYYNYPRKITAQELSERIGCSKSTIIEHLRKIENKLIFETVKRIGLTCRD